MIGIDIIKINRIKKDKIALWAKKILTDDEYLNCEKAKNKQIFIARTFAAKEALSKARGTGFGSNFKFKDASIEYDLNGKPYFKTHPKYQLSISHEKEYLVAMVVKYGK